MRKEKPILPRIRKVYVRRWHECILCKDEVKKEDMWEVWDSSSDISIVERRYFICTQCCETEEQVKKKTRAYYWGWLDSICCETEEQVKKKTRAYYWGWLKSIDKDKVLKKLKRQVKQ